MLALEGFDALYGARPLQRAIESRVVTALARYLIEQPVARGAALTLDVGADGHVTVRRA
jgi:ATP-dependent Clp protease ATP-binding subunit ClpA